MELWRKANISPRNAARLVICAIPVVTTIYALVVTSSVAAIQDWVTNSDQLTLPALVVDLFARPADVFGWQLPRSSYLFPDAVAYAFAYALSADRLTAIVLAQIPTLLVWSYVVFRTAPSMGRGGLRGGLLGRVLWASAAGILLPLAVTQFSDQTAAVATKYVFTFANHFSGFAFGMLLLTWSFDWLDQRSWQRLAWIGVFLLLLAASNRAIWLFYLVPLGTAQALGVLRSRQSWRTAVVLALAAGIAALVGYRVEESFNRIAVMPYELSWTSAMVRGGTFVTTVVAYCREHPGMGLALAALVGFYVVVLYRLLAVSRAWWRREMDSQADRGWLFDAAVLVGAMMNVIAAMAAWQNIANARYLMMFFFAPALLLRRIGTPYVKFSWVAGVTTVLFVSSAVMYYRGGPPRDIQDYARTRIGPIADCLQSYNVGRGLANYWNARRLTFLSRGRIRIDQLTPWADNPRNLLFYWGNNAYDFLRGHPAIDPYDYVIANDLGSSALKGAFGEPDAVRKCGNLLVWSYGKDGWIFGHLFQGHLEPYERRLLKDRQISIPASAFGGEVGHIENLARVAQYPRDSAGPLISGSHFNLDRGIYRVDLDYAATHPPGGADNAVGLFEIVRSSGAPAALANLGGAADRGIGEAHVWLQVDRSTESVEPRVTYAGGGTLDVRRLSITEVERANTQISLRADDPHIHTLVGTLRNGRMTSTGRAGVLVYGPYMPLAPGRYRGQIRFADAAPTTAVGRIDVAVDQGKVILAAKPIDPGTAALSAEGYSVEFHFDLARPVSDLEVRVFVDQSAMLEITGYEILPSS